MSTNNPALPPMSPDVLKFPRPMSQNSVPLADAEVALLVENALTTATFGLLQDALRLSNVSKALRALGHQKAAEHVRNAALLLCDAGDDLTVK